MRAVLEKMVDGYEAEDSYRKAIEAAADAFDACPPEMYGVLMQVCVGLMTSEAVFQGLRGPIGKKKP